MHVENPAAQGRYSKRDYTFCGLPEQYITLKYDDMRDEFYSRNSYATVKVESVCKTCVKVARKDNYD